MTIIVPHKDMFKGIDPEDVTFVRCVLLRQSLFDALGLFKKGGEE